MFDILLIGKGPLGDADQRPVFYRKRNTRKQPAGKKWLAEKWETDTGHVQPPPPQNLPLYRPTDLPFLQTYGPKLPSAVAKNSDPSSPSAAFCFCRISQVIWLSQRRSNRWIARYARCKSSGRGRSSSEATNVRTMGICSNILVNTCPLMNFK